MIYRVINEKYSILSIGPELVPEKIPWTYFSVLYTKTGRGRAE